HRDCDRVRGAARAVVVVGVRHWAVGGDAHAEVDGVGRTVAPGDAHRVRLPLVGVGERAAHGHAAAFLATRRRAGRRIHRPAPRRLTPPQPWMHGGGRAGGSAVGPLSTALGAPRWGFDGGWSVSPPRTKEEPWAKVPVTPVVPRTIVNVSPTLGWKPPPREAA